VIGRKAANTQFAVGLFAGLGAMAGFGSWPVIARFGALTLDLPVIFHIGLVPRHVSKLPPLVMVAGSGVPFFLSAAAAGPTVVGDGAAAGA
jgi:hypothetical protein